MFPRSFYPPSFFPPDYFEKPSTGGAPPAPKGKGKGYAGKRLIQMILQQEISRQNLQRSARIQSIETMLERAVEAKRFRDMEDFAIRRQNTVATYSVLFTEL